MKLFYTGLAAAAGCFLVAALLGHTDAWSPAALLSLAAAAGWMTRRKDADKQDK